MWGDLVLMAWRAMWERRGRTLGIVVAVAVAFAGLAFAIAIGDAVMAVVQRFFGQGLDTVAIFWRSPGGSVAQPGFTDADVAAVAALPGVRAVVPVAALQGLLRTADGRAVPVTVYGVPQWAFTRLVPEDALLQGRASLSSSQAVLGYAAARDPTGGWTARAGDVVSLEVAGRTLTVAVAGVLAQGAAFRTPLFLSDAGVYLDVNALRPLVGPTYPYMVAVAEGPDQAERVAEEVRRVMPHVQTVSLQAAFRQAEQGIRQTQLLLGGLAGIATVVAGLWIYDTMVISVIQRTKEIGILRAVGFRRRQVALLFLLEAAMMAAAGLALGGLLLAAAAFGLGPLIFREPLPLLPTTVAGSAGLVAAAVVAGALAPAARAGRMELVQALKYE